MANDFEQITRVLPTITGSGESEILFPLAWTLPGQVKEFNEAELTVMASKAVALDGEICATVVVAQQTYYVSQPSGRVEKKITTHTLTHLLAQEGLLPADKIVLKADAIPQGTWRTEFTALDYGDATLFQGECKIILHYTVYGEQTVALFKAARLDDDIMSERVDVETVSGNISEIINLSLPVDFASLPLEIESLSAWMDNLKTSAMSGWVKFEGDLVVSAAYQTRGKLRFSESFVFPQKFFVEAPGATAEMTVEPDCGAEILTCKREPEDTAGILRGLLRVRGRLACRESLEVIMEGSRHQSFLHQPSSGQDFDFTPSWSHPHGKKPFMLEEVVAAGSSQTLIEREIQFPRRVRKVREPVDAHVRNLQHELIPGKVIVKGVLQKQLYAVDAETGVVFAVDVDESFVHFVDVPGASPGMRAHVQARVEYVRVHIHPGGLSARQSAIIEITAKITRPVKKGVVFTPVSPPFLPVEPPSHKPPGTVYIVRPGDSVWKIANMFGVPMERIIAANNLQNPNLIFPGQRLIIPR